MSQVTVSPVVQALTVSVTTQSVSISASSPSGAASGDLSGSYPSPTVRAIQENLVQSGTPDDGSVWFYVEDDEQWNHVPLTDVLTFNNIGWDGTSLTVPRLTLQNSEYIRNTVNGRIDLMPAPHPAGDFGVYFDLTSSADYAIVGTIDSAGNLNTNAGFQFANTLAIAASKYADFGNTGGLISYFAGSGNNGVWQFAPYIGSGNAGAICLVSQSGLAAGNRRPATAHTNPTLYVYAAGTANADDFVRVSHDATDALVEAGRGELRLKGASAVRIESSTGAFDLPATAGTSGQVLGTDGSNASWQSYALDRVVTITSDVTNSNATANTIANVTGLEFSILNGKLYEFEFVCIYTAAATTTGSRWCVNASAGAATNLCLTSEYSLTTTTTTRNALIQAFDSPAASNATSATAGNNVARMRGTIRATADATFRARFASEVASSAIVCKAGSFVRYRQVD